MNKAILILNEMPEDCCQCPCFFEIYEGNEWHSACWCLDKEVAEYGKPSLCPLKPTPEKMGEYKDQRLNNYAWGWNDCLDEITGGEKND